MAFFKTTKASLQSESFLLVPDARSAYRLADDGEEQTYNALLDSGATLGTAAHPDRWGFDPEPGMLYVATRAVSSRVNANYDGWPKLELEKSWRTFIGKPVYVEHYNWDRTAARGVILDAKFHKDKLANGRDDWWVELLTEVDASAYPKLAKAIVDGDVRTVSMGADVGYTVCSVCSNKAHDSSQFCSHVLSQKGQMVREGDVEKLAWEDCYDIQFFEISYVFDPADESAFVSDHFMMAGSTRPKIRTSRRVSPLRRRRSGLMQRAASRHARQKTAEKWGIRGLAGDSGPIYRSMAEAAREILDSGDEIYSTAGDSISADQAYDELGPDFVYSRRADILLSLPEDVDTLQDDTPCPVCGEEFDQYICDSCGYEQPPEGLDNPDFDPVGEAAERYQDVLEEWAELAEPVPIDEYADDQQEEADAAEDDRQDEEDPEEDEPEEDDDEDNNVEARYEANARGRGSLPRHEHERIAVSTNRRPQRVEYLEDLPRRRPARKTTARRRPVAPVRRSVARRPVARRPIARPARRPIARPVARRPIARPARPVARRRPVARPVTRRRPTARPVARRPIARPVRRPVTRPVARRRPVARPVRRPAARPVARRRPVTPVRRPVARRRPPVRRTVARNSLPSRRPVRRVASSRPVARRRPVAPASRTTRRTARPTFQAWATRLNSEVRRGTGYRLSSLVSRQELEDLYRNGYGVRHALHYVASVVLAEDDEDEAFPGAAELFDGEDSDGDGEDSEDSEDSGSDEEASDSEDSDSEDSEASDEEASDEDSEDEDSEDEEASDDEEKEARRRSARRRPVARRRSARPRGRSARPRRRFAEDGSPSEGFSGGGDGDIPETNEEAREPDETTDPQLNAESDAPSTLTEVSARRRRARLLRWAEDIADSNAEAAEPDETDELRTVPEGEGVDGFDTVYDDSVEQESERDLANNTTDFDDGTETGFDGQNDPGTIEDVEEYDRSARLLDIYSLVEERESLGLTARSQRIAEIARFERMNPAELDGHRAATEEFKRASSNTTARRQRVAGSGAARMPDLGSGSRPPADSDGDDYLAFL